MPLLNLPKGVVTRQTKTRVAEDDKKVSKRSAKIQESDEELSLRIFELFSRYEHRLITTEQELKEFLALSEEFGLDTETSGLSFYIDEIAGFSLGTEKESAYIPLHHVQGKNYTGSLDNLFELLSKKRYYGFNWKFDKHFLVNVDKRFETLELLGDGYIAARIYDNNLDAGLKPLYKTFIDPNVEDYSFSSLFRRPFTEYDPALVYPYAAVDAQKHIILAKYLEKKLEGIPTLLRLYKKLELPLTEVIGRMERYGVLLDRDRIYALNKELTDGQEHILQEIKEITQDENFNPGSPKQVTDKLKELGLYDGLSGTGEEELKKIESLHPLPRKILEYRGVAKLAGTYTIGLLDAAGKDNVAHPVFNQLGTDTGRFSSTRFNAQNIPKDNRFRNLFIPKPGNKMVSVDYSQQEVRILAALAEDEAMIDAFRKGGDFYAVMASIVFNLPYEECTKTGKHSEYRGHMKSVVLGLNYDMSVKSLAMHLGRSLEEAQEINDKFQKTCPMISAFKKKCRDFAYSHGYSETVLGRRRYFEGVGYKALGLPRFECSDPDVLSTLEKIKSDRWSVKRLINDIRKENEERKRRKEPIIYVKDRESIAFMEDRQTFNSVIQGTAADMTKLAMLEFDRDKIARDLGAHIILQIHDEVIIECPAENAVEAGDRLAFIMNGVGAELMNGLPAGGVPTIMDRWEKD